MNQGEEQEIDVNDTLKLSTIELCARYADDLNENWRNQEDEFNYRWMFLPEKELPKCKIFKSTTDIAESGRESSGGKAFLGTAGCKPGHEDLISYCIENGWDVLNLSPSHDAR